MAASTDFFVTGNAAADALLADPYVLLTGMVLQQPVE